MIFRIWSKKYCPKKTLTHARALGEKMLGDTPQSALSWADTRPRMPGAAALSALSRKYSEKTSTRCVR